MATPTYLASDTQRTSLPLEIHAATRSSHLTLNKLITARLPLCIPPHATTPAEYAFGIRTFGQIYISFERIWDEYLESDVENDHMNDLLRRLRMPSLSRSTRLQADLSLLQKGQKTPGVLPEGYYDEVERVSSRISQAIRARPYLLLSYSWTMYMALFNGGRWMREQLRQAGPNFWATQTARRSSEIGCLSFWDFEGDEDGEDIKADFKARFNAVAVALSDTERQDIIDECVKIFELCTHMVASLDQQTQGASAEQLVGLGVQSWLAASYSALSTAVAGVWSGLMRLMPSFSVA